MQHGMTTLQIEQSQTGDTPVWRLSGQLMIQTLTTFKALSEPFPSRQSGLLLDLSGLVFIDSAGVGVLLGFHARFSRQGGWLAFFGISPALREMLNFGEVLHVLHIYPDQPHALLATLQALED